MDIYEKILGDHHNIREAFEELLMTDNSQIETRNRLLKELERLYVSHTNSEDQTLYQALLETNDPEAMEQVKKARMDHDRAEEKLEALKETPLDSQMFLSRLEEFQETVLEHFDEEESDIFEMAQDLLSTDDEHLLEEELDDLEDNIWNQPQY